jgi:hypothetical protein
MRAFVLVATTAALFAGSTAHAQVQSQGPEVFPGKLEASVEPIGAQAGFVNRSPTGYKLLADFAGLIAPVGFGGVWLGGGLNYSYGLSYCYFNDCGGVFGLWVFAMMTFEKLIPIPLVPFARAGVGGDVLLYSATAGAFIFRVGGGAHYYILKWLGLGLETNFSFGPGFYPNGVGTLFYGHWDFGMGARFNF